MEGYDGTKGIFDELRVPPPATRNVRMIGGPDDGKVWAIDSRTTEFRIPRFLPARFVPGHPASPSEMALDMRVLSFPIRRMMDTDVIYWEDRRPFDPLEGKERGVRPRSASDTRFIDCDRPASPLPGDVYYDASLRMPRWWNGTEWLVRADDHAPIWTLHEEQESGWGIIEDDDRVWTER